MYDFLNDMAKDENSGTMFVDTGGIIRYWDDMCVKIFGFTAEEANNSSLDIIIPEKHRQRHWDGFYKVAETGITRYGTKELQVPALAKNGRKLIIRFTIKIVTEDGRITGFASAIKELVRT